MDSKVQLNALDLFAGAGGFSQGMEQAGINVVAAVEFNAQIAKTYQHNHKNTKMIVNDIRKLDVADIKQLFDNNGVKCHIIFGGPPCQGFSMAGRRIRSSCSFLEDERNYLFKEYIRMVEGLEPDIFVIENVPGILNYGDGAIRDEIISTFESLGYEIKAHVLCAADYGVPQTRKRAVFIGNKIGVDPDLLFPVKTNDEKNYVTIRDAISDLPELKAGTGTEVCNYTIEPISNPYQLMMRSKTGVTYNHVSSHHKEETLKILSMLKEGQTMKDLPEEMHTKSVHSGAYGRMIYDKPSYTLTTRLNTPSVGRITHPTQDRTITPREAARIQSFPDDYQFIGDITSLGMQIGNAVPPLMAMAIGKQIKTVMEDKQ